MKLNKNYFKILNIQAILIFFLCNFLQAQTFTEIDAGFPNLYNGDLAWGDYDGDGDLDFSIAAYEDGAGSVNHIYRNNGSDNFTLIFSISAGSVGNTDWGDYDNDGDLDLLIGGILYKNDRTDFNAEPGWTGTNAQTFFVDYDNDGDLDIHRSKDVFPNGGLYKNTEGVYTYDAVSSATIEGGDFAAWGDYDNDGDKDLIVIDGGGSYDSYLYRNDNGSFVDWGFDFKATNFGDEFWNYPYNGFRYADIDWADYDNDGDLDFIICGEGRWDGSEGDRGVTIMYRNDGRDLNSAGLWLFTQTENIIDRYDESTLYEGVYYGSVDFADFSNDGQRDFLASGSVHNWDDVSTNLYINVGTDTFQLFNETETTLKNMSTSSAAVADYDNDGDLDYIQYGYSSDGGGEYLTRLYKNAVNETVVDNPPSMPTNLNNFFRNDTLLLSWEAASDDRSPSAGLTYNVRVGTSPDSQDVVATHAFPDGRLKKPFMGNAQSARIFKVIGLEPDTEFFWSVQAIDAGFKSSPFAEERIFNTSTPVITVGALPDTLIGGEPDTIRWTSTNVVNIKIEYINANEDHFIIENSYPADSGKYVWTVPEITGNGFEILLSNADNANLNDRSERFSIRSRYVKIIEPNGGESFNAGDTAYVSWYTPYESNFRLEYSTNDGLAWATIIDIEQTYGSSTEEWVIPADPSTQCFVRVTDLNHPSVVDVSDAVFTINQLPSISINQFPVILIAEQEYQVQWTTTNVDSIKIELVDDFGTPSVIEESYPTISGKYIWTVPESGGTGFFIRLTSVSNTDVSDESNIFTIAIDVTPPDIYEIDIDPEVIIYGQTTIDSVSIKIFDDSEIVDASVTLHYKVAGAANYQSVIMTKVDGDVGEIEYESFIPVDSQNEKGIQLYASAIDVHGNAGKSILRSIAVEIPAVQNPVPPRSGFDLEDYTLFSIPLSLNNPSVENFLDINLDLGSDYNPDLYRLYSYQNGSANGFIEYTDSPGFPEISPGRGFFIITSKDIAMSSGPGSTVSASDNFEITGLLPGWNLIGHPFNFPVAFDSVYAYSNTSSQNVGFALWTYDGVSGWRIVDSGNLEPWKGYALNLLSNDNNQSFFIPPVPASGLGKRTFTTLNNLGEEWMIQIEASNGNSQSIFNFAGQLNNALDGKDEYDLNSPPVIGNKVSLSFSKFSEKLQVTDVRESNNQGHVWDFNCYTVSNGKTLNLNFKGITEINETKEVFLFNKQSGLSYNLRRQSSIDFLAKGASTKQFQLIVGTEEFITDLEIADKLFPKEFALYNNFPNPFNPETQISFTLAKSENIKLVVYDVLGQKVDVLENGYLDAGTYNVVWNAHDKSSGVYFIRLIAGSKVKTIRAVLLK